MLAPASGGTGQETNDETQQDETPSDEERDRSYTGLKGPILQNEEATGKDAQKGEQEAFQSLFTDHCYAPVYASRVPETRGISAPPLLGDREYDGGERAASSIPDELGKSNPLTHILALLTQKPAQKKPERRHLGRD